MVTPLVGVGMVRQLNNRLVRLRRMRTIYAREMCFASQTWARPLLTLLIDMSLRILHLEDSCDDCELVRAALRRCGLDCNIAAVNSGDQFVAALRERFDVILSDSGIPGYDGREALRVAREAWPGIPFIVVSGHIDSARIAASFGQQPSAHVSKSALQSLAAVISSKLTSTAGNAALDSTV